MFAVVLVHPEIPPNTGNVIRLDGEHGDRRCTSSSRWDSGWTIASCAAPVSTITSTRASRVHRDFAACRAALDADAPRRWFAFTTQAQRSAYDVAYRARRRARRSAARRRACPRDVVAQFPADARLRIPMRAGVRSLNLSNAVAVAVYEAWRQQDSGQRSTQASRLTRRPSVASDPGSCPSHAERAHQEAQLVVAVDHALLLRLAGAVAAVEIHVQQERRHLARVVLHLRDELLRVQRIDARIVFAGDDERFAAGSRRRARSGTANSGGSSGNRHRESGSPYSGIQYRAIRNLW